MTVKYECAGINWSSSTSTKIAGYHSILQRSATATEQKAQSSSWIFELWRWSECRSRYRSSERKYRFEWLKNRTALLSRNEGWGVVRKDRTVKYCIIIIPLSHIHTIDNLKPIPQFWPTELLTFTIRKSEFERGQDRTGQASTGW